MNRLQDKDERLRYRPVYFSTQGLSRNHRSFRRIVPRHTVFRMTHDICAGLADLIDPKELNHVGKTKCE
jgi:hypothetical protein